MQIYEWREHFGEFAEPLAKIAKPFPFATGLATSEHDGKHLNI
jgi:hypothetical protein